MTTQATKPKSPAKRETARLKKLYRTSSTSPSLKEFAKTHGQGWLQRKRNQN